MRQELGGLAVFDPKRVSKNLHLLKAYVAGMYPETIASNTWEAICLLMHPDLKGTPKNPNGPCLVGFSGKDFKFEPAASRLLGRPVSEADSYGLEALISFSPNYERAIRVIENQLPSLWPVFVDLIAYVVLAKKSGYLGGTVSSRVGLIWIAPKSEWDVMDWVEMLVHEFMHNILFVEDMVRGLFDADTERLSQSDVASRSAIRREIRGYDKSYHSAFVAYGLAEFYLAAEREDVAASFLGPLLVCLEDLIPKATLVSSNGTNHLYELAEKTLSLRNTLLCSSNT